MKPLAAIAVLFGAACATSKAVAPKALPASPPSIPVPADASRGSGGGPQPIVEPAVAYMLGLM
ncbi:MAG TPA: hypothetical protein VK573_07585, partial [Gemmatimonadales bacterium]|nr:hypothetical protein [Gemmatimonadales bacterium]